MKFGRNVGLLVLLWVLPMSAASGQTNVEFRPNARCTLNEAVVVIGRSEQPLKCERGRFVRSVPPETGTACSSRQQGRGFQGLTCRRSVGSTWRWSSSPSGNTAIPTVPTTTATPLVNESELIEIPAHRLAYPRNASNFYLGLDDPACKTLGPVVVHLSPITFDLEMARPWSDGCQLVFVHEGVPDLGRSRANVQYYVQSADRPTTTDTRDRVYTSNEPCQQKPCVRTYWSRDRYDGVEIVRSDGIALKISVHGSPEERTTLLEALRPTLQLLANSPALSPTLFVVH